MRNSKRKRKSGFPVKLLIVLITLLILIAGFVASCHFAFEQKPEEQPPKQQQENSAQATADVQLQRLEAGKTMLTMGVGESLSLPDGSYSCYTHGAMLCYLYNRCGYETMRLVGESAYEGAGDHSWCLKNRRRLAPLRRAVFHDPRGGRAIRRERRNLLAVVPLESHQNAACKLITTGSPTYGEPVYCIIIQFLPPDFRQSVYFNFSAVQV